MKLRAGFWRRFAAFMIDIVLVAILAVLLGPRFIIKPGTSLGLFEAFSIDTETAAIAALLRLLYWTGACYMTLEIFSTATLGKMLFGLRIGDQEGNKAKISQRLLRYLVKFSSMVIYVFGRIVKNEFIFSVSPLATLIIFIGFLLVLGGKKQALHDRIARTSVFRKGDRNGS
jgi:uncharacterized RDD family membrane protein YckC